MSQKPELLQHHYHDWRVRRERFMGSLTEQSQHLRLIESALLQEDLSEIKTKVVELDFELLRYACYCLEIRFVEAARSDCGQLIAESVLDISGGRLSGTSWENWLTAASCWPQLAQEQWKYARSRASDVVVERLESAGISMDVTSVMEIGRAIADLELRDLVPPETYARIFTEETKEEEVNE